MLRLAPLLIAVVLLPLAAACGAADELVVATTTSTQDSGLLDELLPAFERDFDYSVKIIAVGSGQALRLGREGAADVILAHAPEAEIEFMEAGYGVDRRPVMHNRFIIIGPPADPAGIAGLSAREAFARIHASGAAFISRADDSGTHIKEMEVWADAGLAPSGGWYRETGQGMGLTLLVANERRAYTLSDNGTYLAFRDRIQLEPLVNGDPSLINPYHVILVDPAIDSRVNAPAARDFAEFLLSPSAQEIIRTFGLEEWGEPVFVPDALPRAGE